MADKFKMDGYVEAKDRVAEFWRLYPDGRIECGKPQVVQLEGRTFIESHVVVYKHRDHTEPDATGTAWEQFPGKTPYTRDSEAMNAETSAVGRALGFLNIGITGSLASADEVRNRTAERDQPQQTRPGRSVADAKTELVKLCAGQVPGSTEKEHAKAIWEQSELAGDWVTPEDWDVVKAVADAYLADLAEMQGAPA